MKITNKYGLSRSRVNLAYNQLQKPNSDVLRVTELIDSPRIRLLKIRHWEDIEIDCTDVNSNSIWGSAKHSVIEGAVDKDYEAEALLQWWANEDEIHWIKGTLDLYDKLTGTIEDNKWCKIWKWKFKDTEDWLHQLNVYAWLAKAVHAWEVKHVVINASFMDWIENAYKRELRKYGDNCTYPPHQDMRIEMKLWDEATQRAYILDRMDKHIRAMVDLPMCTEKERWRQPNVWALMKEGQDRALKLCASKEEAEKEMPDWPKATHIEYRPSLDKRCVKYCDPNKFCEYWKENYGKD